MGDHLALLVDHLLTESTLEAAIENRKRIQRRGFEPPTSTNMISPFKMVECRICHDEDFDHNMEIPCSCCGTLKYAHRTCVQRWCNEKGDTTCEICLQQFKPNYTAPQQLFHYGSIPMNFRGSWEISRRDVYDSQVITMVPSELGRVNSDYDSDGDGDGSYLRMRSTACCRSVAVIFMVLLVLRHSLPFVITGAEQYSFALFSLLVLRMAGVLFPVFVMVRALATFHRRRRQQEDREVHDSSSESEPENIRFNSTQPHLVRTH